MGETTPGQPGNEAAGPDGADGYWFTPMPIYLLEAVYDDTSPVNAPAAMLWAHLHRNYAWRKRVFPSHATLAKETGQSDSAVRRQMFALRDIGAIDWGANYGPKGRSSNEYALAPRRPFEFDRGIVPPVTVKNDGHCEVTAKNDGGVEVIFERHPTVKNERVVESTVELESTLSPRVPRQTHERTPATPVDEREITADASNDDTAKVVEAWAAARGTRRNPAAEDKLRESAAEFLAANWSIPDLIALAEDMARKYPTGTDLAKHEPFWRPTRAAPVAETCDRCCNSLPYSGWVEIHNPVTGTEKLVRCDHTPSAA